MKTILLLITSALLLFTGCTAPAEQIVSIQAESTPLPAVTPVPGFIPDEVPSAEALTSPASSTAPAASALPAPKATAAPTEAPTPEPTIQSMASPTVQPTAEPTPEPTPTVEPVESTDTPDFGGSILALVNSFRNDAGLDSLKYSSAMQSAADTRAKECAVSFSHTRPDGSSSYTALTERGLSFTAFGENIFASTGMDSVSAEFVVEQWMASQGHRENILRDGFTHMCIGVAAKDDKVYVVQLFGAGIS